MTTHPNEAHIAREIRNGSTIDVLAVRARVDVGKLSNQLRMMGWSPITGNRVRPWVPPEYTRPLVESAGGSGSYIGATDRDSLPIPTQPVAYGRFGEHKRPAGLDWDAIRARYVARLRADCGLPELESLPEPVSKPVRHRGPRLDPMRYGTRRGARGPAPVLSDTDARVMVERYERGESSNALAIEYGIYATTVRNYVVRLGGQVRPRTRGVKTDA